MTTNASARGGGRVSTKDSIAAAQERFALLPDELSKVIGRAGRRSAAAGYGRVFRQMKAITGQGKQYWLYNRAYTSSNKLTGDGRVWAGLNPARLKYGRFKRFPQLPQEFDAGKIEQDMVNIFVSEVENGALELISGIPRRGRNREAGGRGLTGIGTLRR